MSPPRLRQRGGSTIDAPAIAAFRDRFRGQLIGPDDAAYEAARRIWNAQIDKHPGLIARCSGTADIIEAVTFARARDLLVAVRGGGHNVAGRALCDDGLVIDLSAMKGVFVDQRQRIVLVQAGATLGDVDRETHLYGLAVPAGVVSRTGIAGLTLGGGVGWLVRKYGPTCDNLLSCEVVTAQGERVTADAETNPELFWGLRGGGGNFGIVASFRYRAHPVATVLGGLIAFPREQAGAVLRHYRAFMDTAPDELGAYAALVTTPDGQPATAIIACWCGDLAEGERVLRPVRGFATPLLDAIQPMPFPAMQSLLDPAFPEGTRNYWKSSFLRELSDQAIDTIVDHGNRALSPLSAIVIEFYGGAAGRPGHPDTAFAQRQAAFNVGVMAQWTDPAENERNIAWTRAAIEALSPYRREGYLLNFLDEEGSDAVREAFGANYTRLAALKAKYDPDNFFRLNQNVPPAL
ncbi:MAG TPA: FAD-binding oxidoreductase [Acetobacteraceae bacterium]|nr:FAD-binding oxidoreductase [Acetobacteraceae bacterium]